MQTAILFVLTILRPTITEIGRIENTITNIIYAIVITCVDNRKNEVNFTENI